MSLYALGEKTPQVATEAWIAPGSHVIGEVVISARASVWFGAVLRGDNECVSLGEGANIQENCVLHTDPGYPLSVGANCTIGHKAILHGCTIGKNTLVGMGATILNGAVIGDNCLIGAGALVTEGKVIPDGSLVVGAPGKVIRSLDAKTIAKLTESGQHYQRRAAQFARELRAL